jgi:glutaminase
LQDAYRTFKDFDEGSNADYIPTLREGDPKLYGIAIATAGGNIYTVGDTDYAFAIESIAKVFTLCHVMQERGSDTVEEKLGVNPTGLPFNSLLALDLHPQRTVNPLVNAGAIATVSLVRGHDDADRWHKIIETMSRFAGRTLAVNDAVYRSESETNLRNRAITQLLKSYGKLYGDPSWSLDLYTRQSSVAVTARDLAVMGATLASGGVNPITLERVLDENHVSKVLAVMLMNGLYETSGDWAFRVGLPAKSGVGGGILAVVPGRFAIATFSPPLDKAGNSVRGQKAIAYIAEVLDVNVFSAHPKTPK